MRLPHVVQPIVRAPRIVDQVHDGYDDEPGANVPAQVTPMDAGVAYEAWGIAVKNPHLCIVKLADAVFFAVGDRVLFESRTYAVVGVMNWGALPGVNSAEVRLELEVAKQ